MSGLSSTEATRLLNEQGRNELPEKRESMLQALWRALRTPITAMLALAAALSFAAGHEFDGWFIIALFVLNTGVALWHEHKTDTALEELRGKLAISTSVMRDGTWRTIDSRELVVGDYIECAAGDLVPADLRIDESRAAEINEAVLTGESLPKAKAVGDPSYSGSYIAAGMVRGTIVATGARTSFGRIITASVSDRRRSAMEQDILSITRFLMIASIGAAALITATLALEHKPLIDIVLLDLSLLIAGLPVSLPTVMTLIVSLGAVGLARKDALVRRLAALEDLANVDLLLTDKTGTLTESSIVVERTKAYAPFSEDDVRRFAASGISGHDRNLIDRALMKAAPEAASAETISFTPGDSLRKRTTALVVIDGQRLLVSAGTPPVIADLCAPSPARAQSLDDVSEASAGGSRVIAVAIKRDPKDETDERDMELVGLIVLSDPLRQDAPAIIRFLGESGIAVKMMTGDTRETAARIAAVLGLKGTVVSGRGIPVSAIRADAFEQAGTFAEVFPADKLALVDIAQKTHTVAVTGDGVNDLPAIRRADVGIAVENAVDALKGAADIVLLSPGIGVIRTALIESRKVFSRLYSYSIYRISESFRLILTVLVLGFLYADFPLTPIQLIMLALLNDIPIITLAFNRVKHIGRPAERPVRERFVLGSLFGIVGLFNSLLFFLIAFKLLALPWAAVQTAFFLKLAISGHMLIYVAHTRERWYRFLPSWIVIAATSATQALATLIAISGVFVNPISPWLAAFVWLWAFLWMQVSDEVKFAQARLERPWR